MHDKNGPAEREKNGQPLGARRRRVGRPTKYNEETIARLCDALGDGLSIKSACIVTGIGVTTLSEWKQQHPELEDRLSEAREFARQKALQAIKAAGEKDWRAHDAWLKLSFAADYRGKIDVNATAIAAPPVVLTPEQQRELSVEREKAHERLREKLKAWSASEGASGHVESANGQQEVAAESKTVNKLDGPQRQPPTWEGIIIGNDFVKRRAQEFTTGGDYDALRQIGAAAGL